MKKKVVFRGVATALVTPFRDGGIDFDALGHIIDIQIDSGIDALVIAGTTGESSTLTEGERISLYEFSAKRVSNRVPLIFGTGTNSTASSIEYSRAAEAIGADACLVVTPYYNKGTESGIITHYEKIAEATALPIILYNVPSRTGVNLSLDAIKTLAEIPGIVGIKEAQGSTDRLTSVAALADKLTLYSGNDSQIYTTMALGGGGVISVVSNVFPKKVTSITRAYDRGQHGAALSDQLSLLPLINAMFCETNPTPVKYAMSLLGLCAPDVRLPLDTPTERSAALIKAAVFDTLRE